MECYQDAGYASVSELESSAMQQLRQHGTEQTQSADAYAEDHAALRGGAHVSVQPPRLQQNTAKFL